VRVALLGALLVAASIAVLLIGGPGRKDLQRFVDDSGAAAPLVFVALYAVHTLLLFPGALITAAGGALFGTLIGTLLTVACATIGATASFLVGRRLGREQVERIAGDRVGAIDAFLARRGLLAVLYVRLIPVFPFNALNYAAGVTALRMRDYVCSAP